MLNSVRCWISSSSEPRLSARRKGSLAGPAVVGGDCRVGYPLSVSIRRILIVVACGLALSACSGSPATTPSPTPTPTPSSTLPVKNNLDGIAVSGAWLAKPKVTFTAPFSIDQTRRKVLIEGTGNPITKDSMFSFRYYLASGRTGKLEEESFTDKQDFTTTLSGVIKGFTAGLTDVRQGSRVLVAIPGSDSYDGVDPSYRPADYKDGDTLIFVVDITGVSMPQPSGATVAPAAGLPTVTGDAASKPVVAVPGTAAPADLKTQVLIQGTGRKVAKGDIVYSRYVGYSWTHAKLIDDKFAAPEATPLASSLVGLQTGLVGQNVGSRVMFVLPPKYGYPLGANRPPVDPGDTVVYVVDILYAYQQ